MLRASMRKHLLAHTRTHTCVYVYKEHSTLTFDINWRSRTECTHTAVLCESATYNFHRNRHGKNNVHTVICVYWKTNTGLRPPALSRVQSQNNVAELTARIRPIGPKKSKRVWVCSA